MLDAWSRASRNTSYHPCCRDQVALDQLALEFRHFEIDRNFNVGWYELTRTHSHDGLDHTDEIRCDNGALVYAGGRPLLSLHMHISTESSLTVEKRSASHILPKIRAQLAACSSAIPSTLHSTLGLQTRAAPAAPSSPSHPPSPPLSAAEQRTPCIAVMAFDRPSSLEALLGHLNGMDYGPSKGSVVLRIGIDFPEDGAPPHVHASRNATVEVARAFAQGGGFVGGRVELFAREAHGGMVRGWLDAWDPDRHAHPACVLLEDDLVPSRFAWRWTLGALGAYAAQLPTLGSMSWQRQTLDAASGMKERRMPPRGTGPYLYKLLGTWGFVALADSWSCFRRWHHRWRDAGSAPPPVKHAGRLIVTEGWAKQKREGQMWSHWWTRFAEERGLYTLYVNVADARGRPRTLCANTRVAGMNYRGTKASLDFQPLESVEKDDQGVGAFPPFESLAAYGWDARAAPSGSALRAAPCATGDRPPASGAPASGAPASGAPPLNLTLYYLTGPRNKTQQVVSELERARLSFATLPFVGPSKAGRRNHYLAAHDTHTMAIEACPTQYCLLIEDDAALAVEPSRFEAAVRGALAERPELDLLILGHDLARKDTPGLRLSDVREHTARIGHTACGCHAYMVRKGSALVGRMAARARRFDRMHEYCIENLAVDTVKAYLTTTNVWYQRGREKLNEKPGRTIGLSTRRRRRSRATSAGRRASTIGRWRRR